MTPTTVLLKIWPELQNHISNICIIDSQLHTSFYTTDNEIIVKDILHAKKEGKTKFLFYVIAEGVVLKIIQKIQDIANLIKPYIGSSDLIYLCGASDGEEVYEKLYKQSTWENKISVICVNSHWFSLNYSILSSLPVEYNIKEKQKVFLCFNNRPRKHRVELLELMLKHNYVDKGFYSFEGPEGFYSSEGPGFNWDTLSEIYPNIKNNRNKMPLRLNITDNRSNPVDIIPDDIKYFDDSYFSIITETFFYPDPSYIVDCTFITEKTFKCLGCMHPFVMLANPYSLVELRRIGYKTFDPFIDESYDSIENNEERLMAVFKEIQRLISKSAEEWIEWQTNIKEIVEHNKHHFHSSTDYSTTKNIEKYFT
jgi:hypothetical protein